MSCLELRNHRIQPVHNLGYLIRKAGKIGVSAVNTEPTSGTCSAARLTVTYADGSMHQSTWADSSVLEAWIRRRRSLRAIPVTHDTMRPLNEYLEPLVKVIFRFWEHSVIALFPELPADTRHWRFSNSYQHADGHGSANAEMIVRCSRPALPTEYAALKTELEAPPYSYRLTVRSRISPEMRRAREAAWNRLMRNSQ